MMNRYSRSNDCAIHSTFIEIIHFRNIILYSFKNVKHLQNSFISIKSILFFLVGGHSRLELNSQPNWNDILITITQ